MTSPYGSQDSFAVGLYEQPDQFEWTQQDGTEVVHRGVTPDITREDTVETDPFCQQPTQLQPKKLGFCQLSDWDEGNLYDEDPPSWMVSKDTEPDVVLAPASYWRLILKPKLEKLLCKKLAKNRLIKSEDTNVVVSVTERSQRDLTKRFDDTDIDWGVIERQLIKWAEFVLCSQLLATSSRRVDKRGSSITTQMLSERAEQLDGERESSGQPSTHHLKSLIRYVEQGYELQKHEDVPEDIREQLYAEEQQWLERRQRTSSTSAASFPPINITNVLPPHTYQTPLEASPTRTLPSDLPPTSAPTTRLEIPGPRDVAVKNYSHWQQSKVNDDILKVEFRKACDITLADGLDLEQVYEDRDPAFFIDKGIKRGIARRFVGDIDQWAKRYRRAETEE
ncbi:hypothetical protein ACMFMF_011893 [Clarireedia jacksonii]